MALRQQQNLGLAVAATREAISEGATGCMMFQESLAQCACEGPDAECSSPPARETALLKQLHEALRPPRLATLEVAGAVCLALLLPGL
jgi:hypothetical protein